MTQANIFDKARDYWYSINSIQRYEIMNKIKLSKYCKTPGLARARKSIGGKHETIKH